jgi:hypothetical protein
MAKPWVCVFHSQSGGYARATFASKDKAKQFAERHALAFTPREVLLMWADRDDASVLTIPVGEYLVTTITAE